MKIEFLNLNHDPKLDPAVRPLKLGKDSKRKPPAYCLPWVQSTHYSIQIKSNADYYIRKTKNKIEAWIQHGKKKIPTTDIFLEVPKGVSFVPKNVHEAMGKIISVSETPGFSSPWQIKRQIASTLKMGICWWTPPGWGLFFTSAVHRNENFRVIEGFVRTDKWHRDIPIVVLPLVEEVHIPKYITIASAIPVLAQDLQLKSVTGNKKKEAELVHQISLKRTRPSIYKELVLGKK